RSAFRTANGHIGLGPRAMRPGDVTVALVGGAVPFILRPRDGYHLLVGECYVHGVMYEELLDQGEDNIKGLEWFHIY
ncbi:hypothetical protein BCR34DRAFT_489753, partial [Clohesyomyces aquaticus]